MYVFHGNINLPISPTLTYLKYSKYRYILIPLEVSHFFTETFFTEFTYMLARWDESLQS